MITALRADTAAGDGVPILCTLAPAQNNSDDIDIIKRRGRGQVYTKWAKTEILNVIAGEVQESGEQD